LDMKLLVFPLCCRTIASCGR